MNDIPSVPTTQPRITIALCTYNGAQHLSAQLESYLAQTHTHWDLWVSDDGSSDDTLEILQAFAAAQGRNREIRIIQGPRKGFALNFLSLLGHPDFPAQPVALSDQDDVWLPEKLALALAETAADTPVLYGAQSIHTDEALTPIGQSLGGGDPSFGNALVQNIVSGHSMVLNTAALSLVRAAGLPQDIPYHDWWLYQLISGADGKVIVRPDTVLLYRQHGLNAMGSHQGIRALTTRTAQVFGKTYGQWIAANTASLRAVAPLLSPDAQAALTLLETHTKSIGLARPRAFAQASIARQGQLGTFLLYLAVLTGRV
ncbi:MAG: glycosyltransferase [Sulfitobacter sp.]